MRPVLLSLLLLTGTACAPHQIEGWYDASLASDVANYESIVAAAEVEPQSEGIAAMRTLGAIARARYQLDHLSANVGEFQRSEENWERMAEDVFTCYSITQRLAALPTDRLASGAADPEIAAGLDEVRRVVGRWGGAPQPVSGSRRIQP